MDIQKSHFQTLFLAVVLSLRIVAHRRSSLHWFVAEISPAWQGAASSAQHCVSSKHADGALKDGKPRIGKLERMVKEVRIHRFELEEMPFSSTEQSKTPNVELF